MSLNVKHLPSNDGSCLSASFFSDSNFPTFHFPAFSWNLRLLRACRDIHSSLLVCSSCRADLSFSFDCHDPDNTLWCNTLSVAVLVLMGVGFPLCVSAAIPRTSVMSVLNPCWIQLWMRGSNGGEVGVDAVQHIHFVTTETPTLPSFGVLRKLGMSTKLATF